MSDLKREHLRGDFVDLSAIQQLTAYLWNEYGSDKRAALREWVELWLNTYCPIPAEPEQASPWEALAWHLHSSGQKLECYGGDGSFKCETEDRVECATFTGYGTSWTKAASALLSELGINAERHDHEPEQAGKAQLFQLADKWLKHAAGIRSDEGVTAAAEALEDCADELMTLVAASPDRAAPKEKP